MKALTIAAFALIIAICIFTELGAGIIGTIVSLRLLYKLLN